MMGVAPPVTISLPLQLKKISKVTGQVDHVVEMRPSGLEKKTEASGEERERANSLEGRMEEKLPCLLES